MAITPEQWQEFVASRRTTRDFLSTPVPDELIDQLLTDAMTAPSWSNTRPYLVGIAKGEQRDRIAKSFSEDGMLLPELSEMGYGEKSGY